MLFKAVDLRYHFEMATALLDPPPIRTLDTLLEALGDIPTSRIVAWPAPGTATEEDCIRLNESLEGRSCELIDGTLVEKSMGQKESILGSWILRKIGNFADEHDVGTISGEQSLLTLWPGHIRMPDIAYFPWKNVLGVGQDAAPSMVPDIVVEVLSPGNTVREIERKRKEFFEFGTKLFWTVDPVKRIVEVHTSPSRKRVLSKSDILTGGKVLPGFALPMKDIFGYMDKIVAKLNG